MMIISTHRNYKKEWFYSQFYIFWLFSCTQSQRDGMAILTPVLETLFPNQAIQMVHQSSECYLIALIATQRQYNINDVLLKQPVAVRQSIGYASISIILDRQVSPRLVTSVPVTLYSWHTPFKNCFLNGSQRNRPRRAWSVSSHVITPDSHTLLVLHTVFGM